MNSQQKNTSFAETVSLKDILRLLVFYKRFIGIAVAAGLLVGLFITALSPQLYASEAIIEIGSTGKEGDALVEPPAQLVEKIEEGTYDSFLQKDGEAQEIPEVNANHPEDTRLVNVSVLTKSAERGRELLTALTDRITVQHRQSIEKRQQFLEQEISTLRSERSKLQSTLSGLQLNQATTEQALVSGSLRTEFSALSKQIHTLQSRQAELQSSRVIKEPVSSPEPVRPRTAVNMIVGVIIGLFVGVVAVFARTWWQNE